jgi:fructosamine-3-kinase
MNTTLPTVGSSEDAVAALCALGLTTLQKPCLAEKQGLMHTVYLAETAEEGFVAVKLNKAEQFERVFAKEQSCSERARARGVPCPEALGSGRLSSGCFLVSRAIAGRNGRFSSPGEILQLYRKLGAWARLINELECANFGEDLDSVGALISQDGASWSGWCEAECERLVRIPDYVGRKLLTFSDIDRFERIFDLLRTLAVSKPVLGHVDLSHENVMIEEGGSAWLLDWENSGGSTGFAFEVAPISMWQRPECLDSFIEGYGLSKDEVELRRTEIRLMRVWYALRALEWMTSDSYCKRRGRPPFVPPRMLQDINLWIDECFGG